MNARIAKEFIIRQALTPFTAHPQKDESGFLGVPAFTVQTISWMTDIGIGNGPHSMLLSFDRLIQLQVLALTFV